MRIDWHSVKRLLFRLYGPEKPFFDKKWVLPDIERVAAQ